MLDREGFYVQDYGDFSRTDVARGQRGGGAPAARSPAAASAAAAGRGAARRRESRGRRRRPRPRALEQMIADSIPIAGLGVLDLRVARALRNQLLRLAQSHRDSERGVLARSVRATRRLDLRLRERDSVVHRRAQARDHGVGQAGRREGGGVGRESRHRRRSSRSSREWTRRAWRTCASKKIVPLTDRTKREAGMGNAPAHWRHQARADAGDGELHADAHARRCRSRYAFDCEDGRRDCCRYSRIHGIAVEQLNAAASVTAQAFAVDSVIDRGRSETSRMMKDVTGRWGAPASRTLPAGATSCAPASRVDSLAFYLLEPESEDGLAQWASSTESSPPHADFPVVRVTKPATLRVHARRATDVSFHPALPLQPAAHLPLRSQQPAREEDSPTRFVAGETLDEALVRRSARSTPEGITASLDLLGESVTNEREARAAARRVSRHPRPHP